MNFYDKVHELVHSLKETEEYKKYISLKEELKTEPKVYEMLKDFKKKQEEHQMNYINGKEMSEEELKNMQNLYSIIIQNEKARALLESEMRINIILSDMNKIVGEALKEIIEF
jgi:cell fate (sporulation/competence/biofilm development) regulator YlbF (YheA/YmcA/DUF963 family)